MPSILPAPYNKLCTSTLFVSTGTQIAFEHLPLLNIYKLLAYRSSPSTPLFSFPLNFVQDKEVVSCSLYSLLLPLTSHRTPQWLKTTEANSSRGFCFCGFTGAAGQFLLEVWLDLELNSVGWRHLKSQLGWLSWFLLHLCVWLTCCFSMSCLPSLCPPFLPTACSCTFTHVLCVWVPLHLSARRLFSQGLSVGLNFSWQANCPLRLCHGNWFPWVRGGRWRNSFLVPGNSQLCFFSRPASS